MKFETVPLDVFLQYVKDTRYEELREIADEMWTYLQFMPHMDIDKYDSTYSNLKSRHTSICKQYEFQKIDVRRKYYEEYLDLQNRVKSRLNLDKDIPYIPIEMYNKREQSQYRRIEANEKLSLKELQESIGLTDIRARMADFKKDSCRHERKRWTEFSKKFPWFFKVFPHSVTTASDINEFYSIINIAAEDYANKIYDDIMERTRALAGKVKNINFVKADDGHLIGVARGVNGIANINVHHCGGYNVQSSHYRVCVKMV